MTQCNTIPESSHCVKQNLLLWDLFNSIVLSWEEILPLQRVHVLSAAPLWAMKVPSQAGGTIYLHRTLAHYGIMLIRTLKELLCEHMLSHTACAPKQSFALHWVIGRATTAPLSRNCTNDIAWYVLYSGGLSLLHTIAQFGIPSTHSLCIKKKKNKRRKERKKEGREGGENLKLFLSSRDLHVVYRHPQPVACFVFCHVMW